MGTSDGSAGSRRDGRTEPDSGAATTETTTQAWDAWGRLSLVEDFSLTSIGYSQFAALVVNERIAHTRFASWATDAASIDDVLPYALTTNRDHSEEEAVLALAPVLGSRAVARIYLCEGRVTAWTGASELPVLAEAEAWLREVFPEARPTEDRRVPVAFWAAGAHGPRYVSRHIAVPGWSDVRGNYPAAVAAKLDELLTRGSPWDGPGQLILWHGAPGTGKTFALRALAWEWRDWCETHYVTDPEVFWGERSSYLLDVLLCQDDDDSEKWRLLVLEDTGELLSADAKERTGQGLSRLLNVVDGIVGQGFRILVLVTTNEPVRALHAAVARPGRCAAQIEFGPFPAAEAAAWLEARRIAGGAASARTLAELFALAQGRDLPARRQVGFAAGDS